MAVKDALLALLLAAPSHGYQLKADFDAATGGVWPLNVGQVYSTLQRLERDGLVVTDGDPDSEGRQRYALTEDGEIAVRRWFEQPAEQALAARDELSMKVMLAVATDVAPTVELIGNERTAAMKTLQDLTILKSEGDLNLARRLQVDRMVLRIEAEIRWLDLAEERLSQPDDSGPASAGQPETRAPRTDNTLAEGTT